MAADEHSSTCSATPTSHGQPPQATDCSPNQTSTLRPKTCSLASSDQSILTALRTTWPSPSNGGPALGKPTIIECGNRHLMLGP
jgi:hypothetical protein